MLRNIGLELKELKNIDARVLANKWRNIDRQKRANKARYAKYKDKIIEVNSVRKMYKDCLKCYICGENRITEIAHIVSLRHGGSSDLHNLFALCPTHHALFDRKKLNDWEQQIIKDRVELAYKYFELNKQHLSRKLVVNS